MSMRKGIVMVLAGAASYGVLATIVKLAYSSGYSISEVLISQYGIGVVTLGACLLVQTRNQKQQHRALNNKGRFDLIIGGTSFGLTGYFYYLSLQFVPVSIAVVLLMQTVWMGIAWESFQRRAVPAFTSVVAVAITLAGTLMATNSISDLHAIDPPGVLWGLLAAIAYTTSLHVSKYSTRATSPLAKSFYMLVGSSMAVVIIGCIIPSKPFAFSVFWSWGLLLALFGAILPPLLLNTGLPQIRLGFGSMLIAMEIPVSVLTAVVLLKEELSFVQWLGIVLIVFSIILINYKPSDKERRCERPIKS